MRQRVKLTFPQHLIREPVLFTVAKKYDVVPNIRRARVTDAVGEMILELDGEERHLFESIASLREQGVEVEIIEGEIFDT
ncbi:MAG TPA: NIL domain-containing protein [Dissulfurispiraceae bacterium]|nr:NIL domain-containing protein [Dissulfurispiraceae bacterium]